MTQIEKKQCQNSNLEQDIDLHLKNQHFLIYGSSSN